MHTSVCKLRNICLPLRHATPFVSCIAVTWFLQATSMQRDRTSNSCLRVANCLATAARSASLSVLPTLRTFAEMGSTLSSSSRTRVESLYASDRMNRSLKRGTTSYSSNRDIRTRHRWVTTTLQIHTHTHTNSQLRLSISMRLLNET